jgi:predicted DNA-binding transcriptional regulator AlpA
MQRMKQEQSARLIKASELAEMLGVSMRHLWRMKAARELPKPIRLRRSVRWLLSDVEEWLGLGCPLQKAFQTQGSVKAGTVSRD